MFGWWLPSKEAAWLRETPVCHWMVPVRTSARKIAKGLTKKTAKEMLLVCDRCLVLQWVGEG